MNQPGYLQRLSTFFLSSTCVLLIVDQQGMSWKGSAEVGRQLEQLLTLAGGSFLSDLAVAVQFLTSLRGEAGTLRLISQLKGCKFDLD